MDRDGRRLDHWAKCIRKIRKSDRDEAAIAAYVQARHAYLQDGGLRRAWLLYGGAASVVAMLIGAFVFSGMYVMNAVVLAPTLVLPGLMVAVQLARQYRRRSDILRAEQRCAAQRLRVLSIVPPWDTP